MVLQHFTYHVVVVSINANEVIFMKYSKTLCVLNVFGLLWGHRGAPWAHLGTLLGHLGATLGPHGATLGPSLFILGPS